MKRFEVLIAVIMKIITTVLWNVMPYSVKTVTKVLEEPAASCHQDTRIETVISTSLVHTVMVAFCAMSE
jgi:hypothetical protein